MDDGHKLIYENTISNLLNSQNNWLGFALTDLFYGIAVQGESERHVTPNGVSVHNFTVCHGEVNK